MSVCECMNDHDICWWSCGTSLALGIVVKDDRDFNSKNALSQPARARGIITTRAHGQLEQTRRDTRGTSTDTSCTSTSRNEQAWDCECTTEHTGNIYTPKKQSNLQPNSNKQLQTNNKQWQTNKKYKQTNKQTNKQMK